MVLRCHHANRSAERLKSLGQSDPSLYPDDLRPFQPPCRIQSFCPGKVSHADRTDLPNRSHHVNPQDQPWAADTTAPLTLPRRKEYNAHCLVTFKSEEHT